MTLQLTCLHQITDRLIISCFILDDGDLGSLFSVMFSNRDRVVKESLQYMQETTDGTRTAFRFDR